MTELSKSTKLTFRKLLISKEGIEGMLVLREASPRVSGNGDSHKIVFESGKNEGWNACLDAIYALASADKREASENLEPS